MTYVPKSFVAARAAAYTLAFGGLNLPSLSVRARDLAQRQGADPLPVCEIVDGTVLLTRNSQKWGETVLDVLGPGALIGGDGESTADCNIVAATDLRLRQLPDSSDILARRLSEELLRQRERRLLLTHASAMERVATFLLDVAETGRPPAGTCRACALRGKRVHIPVTREEIGGLLNLTIETISRCLAQLRRDGITSGTTRSYVTITDPEALLALGGVDDIVCNCG